MSGQDAQFIATPLSTINGVAEQTLNKLAKLELRNIYDLLLNLPFRYEDRTYIRSVNSVPEEAVPSNFLLTITSPPMVRPKLTEFKAQDHEGTTVKLVFFHASKYLLQRLSFGTTILAWGNLRMDTYGAVPKPVLTHPEISFVDSSEIELPTRLSPVYHLTAGITQFRMREFSHLALDLLARHPLEEYLPASLNPYQLDLTRALMMTHNPEPREDHGAVMLEALPSFQRICFEELIAYKLCILELKARQVSKAAQVVPLNKDSHQKLLDSLPYEPTAAQERVFNEIMADCSRATAMNRLVHGDVGSGKTLVAAMVMEQIASNNMQCAMLAPTDLLAKQHHRKISDLFEPLGIEVVLITGSLKKKERDEAFKKAKTGEAKVFVGTHALFQKTLEYQNLCLVIVDEQHRFGVDQREAMLNKSPSAYSAHELLMTATPIPRSLQQALFSDTDVSTIDMMPKGRSPIITKSLEQDNIGKLIQHLDSYCAKGNQAYWVCPLIEENEVVDSTSVKKRFNELCEALPNLSIGLLHSQVSEKQKNETMEKFINGETNILVATTIVEVGVDVPNASVMVIESADRLGLAQLHQLRGRVGRGSKESFCMLLYQNNAIKDEDRRERALKRLEIMCQTTNGFEIANQDLMMRGPGEFFGTNQAGKENFRFADLNRDYDLVENAKNAAVAIFKQDPTCARNLILRWFPEVLDEENGSPSALKSQQQAYLLKTDCALYAVFYNHILYYTAPAPKKSGRCIFLS